MFIYNIQITVIFFESQRSKNLNFVLRIAKNQFRKAGIVKGRLVCEGVNDNKTRNVRRGVFAGARERGRPTRAEGEGTRNRHEKYSRSRSGQGQGQGGIGLCSEGANCGTEGSRDTASCLNPRSVWTRAKFIDTLHSGWRYYRQYDSTGNAPREKEETALKPKLLETFKSTFSLSFPIGTSILRFFFKLLLIK